MPWAPLSRGCPATLMLSSRDKPRPWSVITCGFILIACSRPRVVLDEGSSCAKFMSGSWAASFCDSFLGAGLDLAWDAYRAGYAACHWNTADVRPGELEYTLDLDDAHWYKKFETSMYDPMVRSSHMTATSAHNGRVSRRCSFGNDGSRWFVERVGPFMFGSSSYLSVRYAPEVGPDFGGLKDLTGSFLSITHANGSVIPFPPLHLHHFHLWAQRTQVAAGPGETMFETHGDGQCKRGEGGTKCYLQMMPPGFAEELTGNLYTADLIGDRVAPLAEPLFVDVALALTRRENVRYRPHFFEFSFWYTVPVSPRWAGAGAVFLPESLATDDYLIWGGMHFQSSYQVVWSEMHTHWPAVDKVWVVAQHPSELGLDASPWILPSGFSDFPVLRLSDAGHTLESFESRLLQWRESFIAEYHGGVLEKEDGAFFDRYNHGHFKQKCFAAGTNITLISTLAKHKHATQLPRHLHIDAFSIVMPCAATNVYDASIAAPLYRQLQLWKPYEASGSTYFA